ncbi:MAG TPA: PspA/IM30 family protein [Ktedonobacteraceae bacterium]
MNLLERVLTLLRANLNTMVEKADDPEKVLRQLQLDMRNQLMQVKTQVATAIAEGRKLQSRVKEKKVEAEAWQRKAEQAIQQNNDPAARSSLSRYNEVIRQARRYQQQQQEQEQLVSTMRGILQQLEAKISEVETTIELLAARKRNALLQQRVYDALNKSGGPKETERANRAQDAVMEAEARARALADLHQRDLDVQLEQLSEEQLLEQQLNELKAKKRSSKETPLLHEGNPHLSPLIPTQPQNNTPAKKRAGKKSEEVGPSEAQPGAAQLDIVQLKKLMEQ